MNREDDFELRMAEWLEEGPIGAPDRCVAAAIEHARTHPRRRFLRSVSWRSAMDSMHLAPVTPRHSNNVGRAFAVGLAALVVVAVGVVSGAILLGSGGREPAPGGVVVPAATWTAAPTPVPTPSPVVVTGSNTVDVTEPGTDTTVGGVEQIRGMVLAGPTRNSDPRVSGPATVHVNIDIRPDQSADLWGTATIAGPDGTWTGPFAGFVEAGYTTHRMAAVMRGTGAYAGLQYRYTQTGTDGTNFTSTGVIEAAAAAPAGAQPASEATVTGTETCNSGSLQPGGSETTVDGVTQTRLVESSCTEYMADPRLSGDSTRTVNGDTQPDGSGTWWGTSEMTNAGGSWTGVWSATSDATGRWTITWLNVGSGGYEGLQYRATLTGTGNANQVTGTVGPIS
ncbi:MAG: hypothetical protein M0Z49_03270 [Chloroflexi bacterium]|nr:hypothetical protein [Chloroflexota bacterium]